MKTMKLTEEEAKEPDFWKLVKQWLEKSPLKAVEWHYKDRGSYTMDAEEFIKWFKSKLVEGMLGDHRRIIKGELIEEQI